MLNSQFGQYFSEFSCKLGGTEIGQKFGKSQLGSVWSPGFTNEEKKQFDIENIEMLNKYKNGKCLFHKTISYLSDRAR